MAVWYKWNGTHCDIRSNRYVAGTGWGKAQLIETDDSGHASDPQVAVDDSGNATVVWRQYDGMHYSIWSNRYAVDTEDGELQNPVLMFVMVTIAAAAVVMSVMYLRFRRKRSRVGTTPINREPPPPP
jgi:hypothetical protein